MKKIIKVMGLPRSGTNAMNLIMNVNFENYVCGLWHYSLDLFGWKHAKPYSKNELEILESRTLNDIKFIFMFRDFRDWQDAIYNRYSGENSSEFTTYSFGTDGFLFNTPMGVEYYLSIEHFYEDRINSYKKFIEENPEKGILVNYEELKSQSDLLNKVKTKFDLMPSNQNFIEINKIVTFNNTITNEKKY